MSPRFPPPPPLGPMFQFPGGRWCDLQRAIVFDSWLTWRHALPGRRTERLQLESEQVRNIATLARLITVAHGKLSRLRPKDSPFRVQRWWDPHDSKWSHGRRCIIEITPRACEDWLHLLPADRVLSVARTAQVAELLLLKCPRARGE